MITDPHIIKTIKIENKDIPVWCYGDVKNPPIIFVHGFFRGFSDYIGDLPIRYLMKNYYVIAFDLPGFGKSKELRTNGLELLEEVYKQILNNKKATIFGVSYGGLLALKYASENPNKIEKLIIAGTPVFYSIFRIIKIVKYLKRYKKIGIARVVSEFDFLNSLDLKKVNIPTLLYYNKSDYISNIFMGNKLNSLLPNSKIFISQKQNHKWLLHRIDRNGFLEEINQFLKHS